MRILIRPRLPVLALLLLAPGIPELLTGSTPITNLVVDPLQFAIGFGADIALYGTGALLIREFVVAYRKGWASTLLLGAAYGIAEEGFAVHTFFQPSGAPVGLMAHYGHAFGVNWLWALGLTVFHATYSIALPILLVGLWFPDVRRVRWLDRGNVAVVSAVYAATVGLLSLAVGHGPSPAAFAFFAGVVLVLLVLAGTVPADLLRLRGRLPGAGHAGTVLAGALGFAAWTLVLVLAGTHRVPAGVTAGVFVGIDLGALAFVLGHISPVGLERSEFYFATGMLGLLFLWDVPVEFSIPGILGVAALFGYLQYRLGQRIAERERGNPAVPPAVAG